MADMYFVNETTLDFVPKTPAQERKLAAEKKAFTEKLSFLQQKSVEAEKRDAQLLARLDQYNTEYQRQEEEDKQMIAKCRKENCFYRVAEPKVLLVVRIKGVNKLCPRVRKIFMLFRLNQIHNAVFVKINKATLNMIKHIEPFIAYGYPTVETVRKLIYKRGYVRDGPRGAYARVALTDNELVDKKLGKLGVHGVEDMVHQIYTCGEAFKEVNNYLWTFKLHAPRGGFVCKRHGFAEMRKGDWGNREQYINDFVQRML